MFREALRRARTRFIWSVAGVATAAGFLIVQHWDDAPPRPALAKGTPLSVYRMHCASTGNLDDEDPGWQSYEISFEPASGQFVMRTGGEVNKLPPAMISGPVAPDNQDYFMVLTQAQLNTASGVTIVNLQAVLPMKAGLESRPLSFTMSIPHGALLRNDSCTSLD